MKTSNFTYPDIPFTSDRTLYDYFFTLDRLLREFGGAISELNNSINTLTRDLQQVQAQARTE